MDQRICSEYARELACLILERVKDNFEVLGLQRDQVFFDAVEEGIRYTLQFFDEDLTNDLNQRWPARLYFAILY